MACRTVLVLTPFSVPFPAGEGEGHDDEAGGVQTGVTPFVQLTQIWWLSPFPDIISEARFYRN